MNAVRDVPESLADMPHFLRAQLASFPGRVNVMLRCVLVCAIVIVTSMTLEVPALAVSVLVVFYVTQSNVVITRLAGIMFIAGSTLAIALSILLLKFTFDYPLLRIVAASLLFFGSVYLMRILKIGIMFFLVALVIIYVQTFVDLTGDAEALTRAALWAWVAVNYSIVVTLLVNTVLLPAEPQQQLKAEIHRQLLAVDARLASLTGDGAIPEPIAPMALQQGALALQKLLRFTVMREARHREDEAHQLARIATVSQLYRAAADLPAAWPRAASSGAATQQAWLHTLRAECRALDAAVTADVPYRAVRPATPASGFYPQAGDTDDADDARDAIAAAVALQRALHRLSDLNASNADPHRKPAHEPMVAADAFSNPVYVRFSLKTLLAVLLSYLIYNALDWKGIHTIMLTCVIMALPSLGASTQRAVLRVGGALIGSALALFMAVFVIQRLDGIVGLLLMSLPVIALGAWVSAGSERISYAGIQIAFTFSLALLEDFGPSSDLTEIRDRMVGILLGVGISTVIQMSLWPEGEGDMLRQRLATMLRSVGALLRGSAEDSAPAQQALQVWAVLADCEAMLARVALEPSWQEGEQAHLTLRAQTVLAQGREIMFAAHALHNGLALRDFRPDRHASEAARAIEALAASAIERYADELAAQPPAASAPRSIPLAGLDESEPPGTPLSTAARNLVRQLTGLPDWGVPAPMPAVLRESHEHD
jgi:multidrug resistance protein MdtO